LPLLFWAGEALVSREPGTPSTVGGDLLGIEIALRQGGGGRGKERRGVTLDMSFALACGMAKPADSRLVPTAEEGRREMRERELCNLLASSQVGVGWGRSPLAEKKGGRREKRCRADPLLLSPPATDSRAKTG